MRKRVIALLVIVAALGALAAGPASADPSKGFGPISVDCGSTGSFDIVVQGSANWTAAHVIGSTEVLVPLGFGESSFTYTDPDGVEYPPEPIAPLVKGSGKQAGVWCDYSFDIDTGNGLENLSGSGTVYGKMTPGK